MRPRHLLSHRTVNLLHTTILMAALLALLCVLGWFFAGVNGILFALFLSIIPLFVSIRLMPSLVLKMYKAEPLSADESPQLYSIIRALSARAGFSVMPRIYFINNKSALVFSVGEGKEGAIAVSASLLHLLTLLELVGVIWHEMCHIRNKDTVVMSFADVASRLTSLLSFTGQLLLVINLPLLLLGGQTLPWI